MRKPINLSDNTLHVVTKMGEGNPGAINVLTQLLDREHDMAFLMVILKLDDMNIRGPQIWVGYKDVCKQDIEVFVEKINARNQDMVDVINAECYLPEHGADYMEKAVTSGASFDNIVSQNPDVRGMGL